MLVVAALGGNALIRRGQPLDADVQRENVRQAASALAPLARAHQLVVTHGNGPQVGLLALQSAAYPGTAPYPVDVLDAESEGMIGYLLDQALANELPDRDVATLLTQVVVDPRDPAFRRPTKPIGPMYDMETAKALGVEHGWTVARDGAGWRRVLPSPAPLDIVELRTIELLVDQGVVVVCTGGGGIPVMFDDAGALRGVEGVVDKDASSALLAERLAADHLLLLTDVSGVVSGFGGPEARLIRRARPDVLARGSFAEGSMGPKVAAACAFVEATGCQASIGALGEVDGMLAGIAGTLVTTDAPADLELAEPVANG
jgi:carbamate kinase